MIPAGLVVACIGYRTSPIPDVPFDEREGRFANDDGRILPGLYCVGWARRGPSGTIGTNRPDGFSVVEKIAEDAAAGTLGSGGKRGRAGFDALAAARGLDVVTFRDWKKIEEAEERPRPRRRPAREIRRCGGHDRGAGGVGSTVRFSVQRPSALSLSKGRSVLVPLHPRHEEPGQCFDKLSMSGYESNVTTYLIATHLLSVSVHDLIARLRARPRRVAVSTGESPCPPMI